MAAALVPLFGLPPPAEAYVIHAPISISGDSEFTGVNGVVAGHGTSSDPYVIAGWDIDASGANGIEIGLTHAFFVVRDVRVHSNGAGHAGIHLNSVASGRVENATVEGNLYGISVEQSVNVVLANCTVSGSLLYNIIGWRVAGLVVAGNDIASSGADGVSLQEVTGAVVARNRVHDNGFGNPGGGSGILAFDSADIQIASNQATSNNNSGVWLHNVTNAEVRGNQVTANRVGAGAHASDRVVVEQNEIAANAQEDVLLWAATNTTVEGNRISGGRWAIRTATTFEHPGWENAGLRVADNNISDAQTGVWLDGTANVTVEGNEFWRITWAAVWLYSAWTPRNTTVVANRVVGSGTGVMLAASREPFSTTRIEANSFTENARGINAAYDGPATVAGNRFSRNGVGAFLGGASGLRIYHNRFEDNAVQASDDGGADNAWDDGYPSGGNWWSDYTGPDLCSGPAQDVCPDPDGIGDVPRTIDADSRDRYPLRQPSDVPPWAFFTATPVTGNVTTTFVVDGSGSRDLEDPSAALAVRWDWEGDGAWDTPWSTDKVEAHAYAVPGQYTARMEVRDSVGLTDEAARDLLVVNLPPTAAFSVSPRFGGVGTPFLADASGSSDLEDSVAALEVRWDWDGDGTWDTAWSTAKLATHAYPAPGTYDVRLQVRDTAGFTDEADGSVAVLLGPQTRLLVGDPNVTAGDRYVSPSTPLDFTIEDRSGRGIVRTWYRIDGVAWTNYTATGTFTLPVEGAHTVEWFSEDSVGNVESTSVEVLRVDATPPSTTITIGDPTYSAGDTFVTSGSPLAARAIDGGVTPVGLGVTSCRVDGGTWAPCAAPFFVRGEGAHSIEYFSSDLLGNAEPIRTATVVVDDTAPVTVAAIGPSVVAGSETFVTSASTVTLAATDEGVSPVGVAATEYRVDAGRWTPYTGAFTLPAEGTRTVEYRSADRLGNAEIAHAVVVVVDDTPPSVIAGVGAPRYRGPALYVSPATAIALDATDGGVVPVGLASLEYRVGGPWTPFTSPFTLSGPDGPVTIEYRASDRLGNAVNGRVAVVLDGTPPTTTIAPGAGAHAEGTVFSLNATDIGSGVARTEYAIDGAAWTPYVGPFVVPAGDHTVAYRSTDRVDNREAAHEVSVHIEATPPPGGGEPNLKPLVAAIFVVILVMAGTWASRRRPWRGRSGGGAVLAAFAVTSLPFVAAEGVTGAVSFATGLLSIPPIAGSGTAVDVGIVIAGIVVASLRLRMPPGS